MVMRAACFVNSNHNVLSNSQYETVRGRYGGGAPVEGAGRTLRVLLAHATWVAKAATSGRSEGKAFPFKSILSLPRAAIGLLTFRLGKAYLLFRVREILHDFTVTNSIPRNADSDRVIIE